MSWVVDDSEDEGDFIIPAKPTHETHSTISDFSTHEIVIPLVEDASAISEFTTDNSTKIADTSADSIIVPSTSALVPAKPKRPKPRPAYQAYREAAGLTDQSISSASVTASVINKTNPGSLREPLLDAGFSLDIAERAKMRKRVPATGSRTDGSDPVQSSSHSRHASSITEGSSKDMIILYSPGPEVGQTKADLKQGDAGQRLNSHRLNAGADAFATSSDYTASTLPPSSIIHSSRASPPPVIKQPRVAQDTTPSHFHPQRKKRKARTDDFVVLDDSMGAEDDGSSSSVSVMKGKEPSAKKHKGSKEKKLREGDVTEPADGNQSSRAKSPTTKVRKHQSKAKGKVPEQEFKSKEFIEESDDELALVPSASKSNPWTSRSDPADADVSVDASVDISVQPSVFLPTRMVLGSASVLPSALTSVRHSAAFSELPSADISAPPPSPSVPKQSSHCGKSKSERRKKTAVTGANCSSSSNDRSEAPDHEMNRTSTSMKEPCGVPPAGPQKEARKKARQSKGKGRIADSSVSPVDGGKLDGSSALIPSNPSDSADQDSSAPGNSRPTEKVKDPKKKQRRAIVSSDEEDEGEPGPAPSKDKGKLVGMEGDKIEKRDGRCADKENRVLSPTNDRPEKASASPSSVSASAVPARSSNPKPQLSTPKMPSRRDSMSALIRRVSSRVQSPLSTPSPGYCHSPLAKASRAVLSRIAPLHPNRRTPPPPPPHPPRPKKSKKMLLLEEKWEMELAETVEGWSCMTDEERAALRRAKRDAELGYDD